jgi:small subunit ribosomal protein S20
MANRPSALKSLRRDNKRALRNKMVKTRLRTELNRFTRMVERGEVTNAEKQVALLTKLYQRAADRKIVHPNHAARKQAQFQRTLTELKAKAGAGV